MMIVLGKISVNLFIHFGALVFLGTILLCYILAVSLHHVPAWLPMISDCALLAPEKYPFRWGFMVGSALLGVQSLLIYGADKPYSKSKLALFTGVVAAFCLSVVGVVNEEEDNIIHSGSAVIAFVAYEINMIVLTWFTPQNERRERLSTAAFFLRQFCVVIDGLLLLTFAFLATDWGKYKLYIAMCEWSGVILILIFNWSFAADFSRYSLGELQGSSDFKQIPYIQL